MKLAPGEGPYDGRPPEWWQERFRFYRALKQTYERDIKRLTETYYNVQRLSLYGQEFVDAVRLQQILDAIKSYEGYMRVVAQKLIELDRRASDAAVPRNLRE